MIFGSPLATIEDCLWRNVVGSEGKFEVSNQGEIRKVASGSLVKLTTTAAGYLCCGVSFAGRRKTRRVNIMVAEAFIGPRPDGHEVGFIDNCKTNCRLSNIHYGTPKELADYRLRNGFKQPSAKLTANEVLEIRRLINSRVKFETIAAQYGVSYGTVKKVSSRSTWAHI